MPRKSTAKATGVWEKERGVWWIRYRAVGKLKREKSGAGVTRSLCISSGNRYGRGELVCGPRQEGSSYCKESHEKMSGSHHTQILFS